MPDHHEVHRVPKTWSESDRFVPRSFVRPVQQFMQIEASGAIVMLAAAVAALIWANSPWHEVQEALLETHLDINLGDLLHLELTLVEWINDGLMALFFFVVGLEIKREFVHGELQDPRQATLPAIGALGGMVLPAAIYLALNAGGDGSGGWGIPVATDIAFAVAIVALVGNKVPAAARVFLLTLAIADDIGAIAIIAIFYSDGLSFIWLAIGVATFATIAVCTRLHIRPAAVYVSLGAFSWLAIHESGVHATIAGVAVGLLTPAWAFFDPRKFPARARMLVDASDPGLDELTAEEYELNQDRLHELDRLVTETISPLERAEHRLVRWVSFAIVPLFAFANAGVRLTGDVITNIPSEPVILGIVFGLVVGKTVGVFGFTLVGARLGLGRLPEGVTFRHVLGIAATAGVGFTVALFVSSLAFDDPGLADQSRIGILLGSLIAGVMGYLILRSSTKAERPTEPEQEPQESAVLSAR